VTRWAALVLTVATASACGHMPVRIESHMLAGQTSDLTRHVASSPERFIIAAVDNGGAGFPGHAGSTPRGYDAVAAYGPTPRAREVMRSLEHDYGLREVNAWPIQPLHMYCAVLEVPGDADRAALLGALSHDRRIRLTQPLQTFATRTESYNDPYVGLQRGFRQMDVGGAQQWSRGEGVRVAVIDTGADTEHPDLRGAVVVAENLVDSDERQFRRDRHGTEIVGVIAAVANNHIGIVGIAPASRIMVFKACWQLRPDADAARCNSYTLARALAAAFDAHAQVVNLSIAGPADPLLRDLITAGLRRGIVIVGAAAAADQAENSSFLDEAGVIEVADAQTRELSSAVLNAPGREILTLLPGGRYDFASGVSLATAQVTGVVALVLAKRPGLSPAAVYRLLRDTSVHPSHFAHGRDRVDACAAVVATVDRGACRSEAALEARPDRHRVKPVAWH